ncbi:hypothetical protein C7271_13760 [filamentous cyanobacterium CCP5]|nr:hypothetical protein C7271_13760 [filamentous cyanobacterium CCP5]
MSFFNHQAPILRRKQTQLDVQDLEGLIHWEWKINGTPIVSLLYTRIDQVFLLWGWIVGVIFLTPQFFSTFAWTHQALLGTLLSIAGTAGMAAFAWFWVKVERLRWLIYLWGGLVLLGLGLTNYGVFGGVGEILVNLCPLWLGLCGLGYGVMGAGLRSRTFLLAGGLHLGVITLLGWAPTHQFLITAAVMAGTLFLLAEVQWDMRSPVASPVLSAEQIAFNQRQHQLRNPNNY